MDKKKKYICMLLILIAVTLLKICNLMQKIDVALIADDIGSMALPSYLAGLDWKATIATTNYYGYGFKWIYFILFKFIDNPYILYYAILGVGILFIDLVALLIGHIIIEYFKIDSVVMTVGIVVFISNMGSITWDSELSVYASFWVAIWFICKLISCENDKSRMRYSVCMALWLGYMMTLHERNLAVLLAAIFIVVGYHILFKTRLVQYVSFGGTLLIGYYISKNLNAYIQNFFWSEKKASGSLGNVSAVGSLSSYIEWFKTEGVLKGVLDCMVSNLVTLAFKTYGIAYIGIALVFVGMFFYAKGKGKIEVAKEDRIKYTVLVMSAITVMIVIVGLSTSWGISAATGDAYGYKGYSYYRYYNPYVGPAVVAVIAIMYHNIFPKKIVEYVTVGVMTVLCGYYFIFVFWNVYSEYIREESIRLERMLMYTFYQSDGMFGVMVNIIISAIISCILCILLLKINRKSNVLIYIYCVMIIFPKIGSLSAPTINCTSAGATYALLAQMQNEELPDKIYAETDSYTYQFMLSRFSILEDKQENENTSICVSNNVNNKRTLFAEGFRCAQLDEYEYIYV